MFKIKNIATLFLMIATVSLANAQIKIGDHFSGYSTSKQ